MKRKKMIIKTAICALAVTSVYNFSFFNPLEVNANAEVVNNTENTKESSSENSKLNISRDLFNQFINENRVYSDKTENSDSTAIETLTDYKVNDVNFICGDDNKFTVRVYYDIKYTDDSNMWIAGNGKMSNENWIKNKTNFVDIEKVNGSYKITRIYT